MKSDRTLEFEYAYDTFRSATGLGNCNIESNIDKI